MADNTYPAEVYVYSNDKWVSISPHCEDTGIQLNPATATELGGVKIGDGVSVTADGTISVSTFSGDYDDLTNKPIPVQSDWLATGGDAYIKNKPNHLSNFNNDLVISAFPNDANYVDAAGAAAAAPVQSIIAGDNVAVSDDGNGNVTIAATGGGTGPGGGVESVSGQLPISVTGGTDAAMVKLDYGESLILTNKKLEVDYTKFAPVALSGSYNDLIDVPPGSSSNLPIESVDGTVVLDSPSPNTFDINTAGVERLRVTDTGDLQAAAGYVPATNDSLVTKVYVDDAVSGGVTGHKLPIESVDGTVVLDSPAADTFTINTGGNERLIVDEQGRVGVNAYSTPFTPSYRFHIKEFGGTEFFASGQFFYSRQDEDKETGVFLLNNQAAGGSSRSIWGLALDAGGGNSNGMTVWASSVGPTGDPKWTFTKDSGIVAQNASGYLQTGLGTAAAPSVSMSGDEDTGSWSPGANQWAVSTGGVERIRVRDDGNVGLGYAGQANINFSIYKTFGVSTVEAIGIMVASRFDGQPSQQCVGVGSRPEFKGVVASNIRHFMAEDSRGGNQPFSGIQTGFCAADLDLSTTKNVGFETAQTGSSNLAFFASGSSPSQLNGGVRVSSANAASPGYAFIGSEETGTFSPGANQWAISTGGVERMRVRAGGNVSFSQSIVAPTTGTSANGITQRFDIASNNGMVYSTAGYVDNDAVDVAYGFSVLLASTAPSDATHSSFLPFFVGNSTSQNGATIGEVRCYTAADQTVADTAYGFYSGLAPRSGKFRYNFYADGTAPNYFAGQVQTGSGTVSAPSVSIFGDEDTGSWSPGANTWAISTGGVERLRVSSSGTELTSSNGLNKLTLVPGNSVGVIDVDPSNTVANTAFGVKLDGKYKIYMWDTGSVWIGEGVPSQTSEKLRVDGAARIDGEITAEAGLATRPGFGFIGDVQTGVFSPSAGNWAVSCGGVERLRVDETGDIQAAAGYTPATANSLVTKGYVDNAISGGVGSHTLPIESEDGTVVLESPLPGVFRVDTNGEGRFVVTDTGNVLMGLDAETNPNFNVHVKDINNVQLCLESTSVDANGGILKFLNGSNYWNIQHILSTSDPELDNMMQIANNGLVVLGLREDGTNIPQGPVLVNNVGSASSPAYAFNSDRDTGSWSPGSNQWAASCGGVERLRVDGSALWLGGKSGLTAGGFEYLFTGDSVGDGKSLLIASGQPATTADAGSGISFATCEGNGVSRSRSTRMYISPEGKVGINKTNPQSLLDVGGDTSSNRFLATSSTAANPSLCFQNDQDTGIYQDTADTLQFTTGGTERLRVKSTGGVKYVPLAAAPATPEEGEVYFDSTIKKLRVYDGAAWVDLH